MRCTESCRFRHRGESPLLSIPRTPSAQSPTDAQQQEKDSPLLLIPRTPSARNELEHHTSLITARKCGRQIHFLGLEHFNDGLIQCLIFMAIILFFCYDCLDFSEGIKEAHQIPATDATMVIIKAQAKLYHIRSTQINGRVLNSDSG